MFDEERPALESDQGRSSRHARMVAAAVWSTVFFTATMTGITALMMLTPLMTFDRDGLVAAAVISAGVWGGSMAWSTWKNW